MAPPSYSLSQIVQQLRTSWGDNSNNTYPLRGTNVQYAILTAAPLDSSPENPGWVTIPALMAARGAEAFEAWDDLIAINLTPYSGNPPANAHIIQFAYSSTTDDDGTYEYGVSGVYQGVNSYGGSDWGMTRAEIWFNSTWSSHSTESDLNAAGYGYYGSYGYDTYLHEIGHALGLSHPGDYNAAPGVNITYAANAEYLQDTHRYTLMSYFRADADGSGTDHRDSTGQWRYPQTPMLHDIAAAQAIYGADTGTRSGNTIYGFNSTAGKDVYDFTKNTSPILTIWDGGGIDTLDLSGFGAGQYGGQVIDLRPGSYSNVGGYMTNNLAIAFGAVIENAIGGTGNDTIYGNSAANVLQGGAGVDRLFGDDGDDLIYWDSADDWTNVLGGNGTDTLRIVNAAAPTSFGLAAHQFEAAEAITTDPGGQLWSQIIDSYDAAWRLMTSDFRYDNNTRTVTTFDYTSSNYWSSIANYYNATGQNTSLTIFYDNSARHTITLDYNNTNYWNEIYSYYNASGQNTSVAVFYDNSARHNITIDHDNTSYWNEIYSYYNVSGQNTSAVVFYDNSARHNITIDYSSTNYWIEIYSYYNTGGQNTSATVFHDNGGRHVITIDYTNTNSWTEIYSYFNAAGQNTSEKVFFDDGRRTETYYDPNPPNAANWSSYIDYYNDAGVRTRQTGIYDNGQTWEYFF